MTTPIIDEKHFIIATRDTGYRSTAAAISEIVDNAVQAGSTIIRIFVEQTGSGGEREITIAVLDNGTGMVRRTLTRAMQFAGSSRFDSREGMGRFGMGLPNSSVSQARRVDVYTWQSHDRVLKTYLDVDQIAEGDQVGVPAPRVATLPPWIEKYVRKRSGTLVCWSRCDRLDNRKSETICTKLKRPLGQRFRKYLWSGKKIYINDELILPFDPLYLRTEGKLGHAKQFGDTLSFEFRVPGNPQQTSTVEVRFTELPIAKWSKLSNDEKRDLGVLKGAGVSIVRAGRELDFGWYFMGGKRRENYDDWWRCEIAFDPVLDELFGVNHSKQEINPSNILRIELSQHLESIAQMLNSRVRSAFALVKKQEERAPSVAEARATEREPFIPAPVDRNGYSHIPSLTGSVVANRKKQELSYRICVQELDIPNVFVWERKRNGLVIIKLNENHSFYHDVYSEIVRARNQKLREGIESVILAMVRSEMALKKDSDCRAIGAYLLSFSNILAAYLGD